MRERQTRLEEQGGQLLGSGLSGQALPGPPYPPLANAAGGGR